MFLCHSGKSLCHKYRSGLDLYHGLTQRFQIDLDYIYKMAFWLPRIKNFLLSSASCLTYSRNSENGGFVTTISASLSSSTHSSLRKSPFPFKGVAVFLLLFNKFFTSSRSIAPSPSISGTSVISILNGSL